MKTENNHTPDDSNLLAATFEDLRELFYYIVSLPEPDRLFFASIIQSKISDLLIKRDSTKYHHSPSLMTQLYLESGSPEKLTDFATQLHKQILETGRPHLKNYDMEQIEKLLPNSGFTAEILIERFMDATLSERKRAEYLKRLCAHFPESFAELVNTRFEELLNQNVSVAFVNEIIRNLDNKRIKLTNKLETWRSLRRYSKRIRYAINTPDEDYIRWQKSGELDG